jgi:uncharacterized membrane protein YkoI
MKQAMLGRLPIIAGFGLLMLATTPATPASRPADSLIQVAQGAIGAEQAAAIARNATGGRVLGVRSIQRDDALVYEVKVLSKDGRVRIIRIDGRNGGILN